MNFDHDEQEWQVFQRESQVALKALRNLEKQIQSETLKFYLSDVQQQITDLLADGEQSDAA